MDNNLSLLEQIILRTQPNPPGGQGYDPKVEMDEVKTEPAPEVKAEPTQPKPVVEKKEEKSQSQVNDNSDPKQWFWTSLPEGEPLFALTRDALGITSNEGVKDSNSVAEIAAAAATLLQTNDEQKVFEFLRKELTKTPANIGNPIYYLRRILGFRLKEQKEKWMKGGAKR